MEEKEFGMIVDSEIGKLKKVIVHRPGLELERLTPENCDKFLFDDVLWQAKAAEEHIIFENVLKEHGTEVYVLIDLLSETLGNKKARHWLTDRVITRLYNDSTFSRELKDFLDKLTAKKLATHLLGGLTWGEMGEKPKGLVSETLYHDDFVLPPLPNHLFTRDTTCWIGNGVSINPMHWKARQGETLNFAAIYKFHPMFKKSKFNVWYDGSSTETAMPTLEGGDVLVLSKDCVAIGLSERSTPEAVETLAKTLFTKKSKKQIIAIEIPKQRSSMHLDTVMTMVDHYTFCIAFPCDTIRSWSIFPGDKKRELIVQEEKDVFKAIAKALGEKKLRLITPAGDEFTEKREQWSDASNLLAIAPNLVIGYERNTHMNEKLRKEKIEILEIPGSELGRGRGGARCMSCPIERDKI